MPRSKGRPKQRSSRYQLEPQRKKKVKASPRWYGPLMLVLMGIGVVAIVWNYTRGDQASNTVLMGGLGVIAIGFFGVTFWRRSRPRSAQSACPAAFTPSSSPVDNPGAAWLGRVWRTARRLGQASRSRRGAG